MVEGFPGAGQFLIARQQFLALLMHLRHQAFQMPLELKMTLMLSLHPFQFSLKGTNPLTQARLSIGAINALRCRLPPVFVGRIDCFLRHANPAPSECRPLCSFKGLKAVPTFYRIFQNMQEQWRSGFCIF